MSERGDARENASDFLRNVGNLAIRDIAMSERLVVSPVANDRARNMTSSSSSSSSRQKER